MPKNKTSPVRTVVNNTVTQIETTLSNSITNDSFSEATIDELKKHLQISFTQVTEEDKNLLRKKLSLKLHPDKLNTTLRQATFEVLDQHGHKDTLQKVLNGLQESEFQYFEKIAKNTYQFTYIINQYYQPFRFIAKTAVFTYTASAVVSFNTYLIARVITRTFLNSAMELLALPFASMATDSDNPCWQTETFYTGAKNISFLLGAIKHSYASPWWNQEAPFIKKIAVSAFKLTAQPLLIALNLAALLPLIALDTVLDFSLFTTAVALFAGFFAVVGLVALPMLCYKALSTTGRNVASLFTPSSDESKENNPPASSNDRESSDFAIMRV